MLRPPPGSDMGWLARDSGSLAAPLPANRLHHFAVPPQPMLNVHGPDRSCHESTMHVAIESCHAMPTETIPSQKKSLPRGHADFLQRSRFRLALRR